VTSAVSSVAREAVIAAALTGLMILLFLGNWRSTLIISISIPLAILASLAVLSVLGETINVMTLGGLALAVGILVDDATVTIENINRHLEGGEEIEASILHGGQEIVVPASISLMCICLAFVRCSASEASQVICSVRSRGSGGVRADCLLHPVLYPCSHVGELSAARPGRMKLSPAPAAIRWCGSSRASNAASKPSAAVMAVYSPWGYAIAAS